MTCIENLNLNGLMINLFYIFIIKEKQSCICLFMELCRTLSITKMPFLEKPSENKAVLTLTCFGHLI